MSTPIIQIKRLSKEFSYSKTRGIRGLIKPDIQTHIAVNDITLTIHKGESVAFIGPNGAGKSTTIKMLCGILSPTSGTISVAGLHPIKNRRELAYQIGTVFGQRSQLLFNLPLVESLKLSAKMYGLSNTQADTRISALVAQFELASFIDQPVRKLSLGQRMRAEIANSLVHDPKIIFLDEPTIGLDVVAKRALRNAIKTSNKVQGTTIFLTSHDAGDIQEVCDRTIIVNHGEIIIDMPTAQLRTNYLSKKILSISALQDNAEPTPIHGIQPEITKNGIVTYLVDTSKMEMRTFLSSLIKNVDVSNLTIEDTPLEDIIHEIFVKQKS